MAPRTTAQRRTQAQNDRIFELGVQGRKTGVVLKDTGVRDEHGMEPLDVFSSPEKGADSGGGGGGDDDDDDDDDDEDDGSEQEMDIDNTSGPNPASLLKGHGTRLPMPLPRSRSPVKTNLKSPARKSQLFAGASSSPTGGHQLSGDDGDITSVRRRLNFGGSAQRGVGRLPLTNGAAALLAKDANGTARADDEEDESMALIDGGSDQSDGGDVEIDEVEDETGDADGVVAEEEGEGGNEVEEEEAEEEEEEEEEEELTPVSFRKRGPILPASTTAVTSPRAKSSAAGKARKAMAAEQVAPAAASDEEDAQPVKRRKRGRPARSETVASTVPEEDEPRPRKRRSLHHSSDGAPEVELEPESKPEPKRRGRPGKKSASSPSQPTAETGESSKSAAVAGAAKATAAKAGKPRARKPAAAAARAPPAADDAPDTSLLAVPRGPPLPRSRGLMISRREVPGGDGAGIRTTRSGRHSFKPLAYWRNERVDYDAEQGVEQDAFGGAHATRMWLPSIKEVVRVDEPGPEPKSHRTGKKRGAANKKRKRASYDHEDDEDDEDEPAQEWEVDPGSVTGPVLVWRPEHEFNPPSADESLEATDEALAVAAGAAQTRPIKNADFRYAKTMSQPFFATGLLDLPPGASKRPKNSRKMYMAFFVFRGRVLVTVNETSFRIRQGGTWWVPRGNYYSIENDYDKPAQLFFCQACEPSQWPEGWPGAPEDMGPAESQLQ